MRPIVLVFGFFGLACSRSDAPSAPADASSGVEAPPASTSAPVAAAPSSAAPKSTACPSGMVEVKGSYCTTVLHRCIRGGLTHERKPAAEPMPYHCEAYEPGVSKCLGKELPKHFCIDEYEYPNREGAIPEVFVTWYESKEACEKLGKRLCGDDEWTLACEGPERLPYTYGWARDATKCNIDKPWIQPNDGILKAGSEGAIAEELARLSQRVPSGSMPGCVSPFGVKDMGGNVDEWTRNVTRNGKPYQSFFKGGHWCKGARNRCRPQTDSHDETTRYYAEGFRCCSDPAKVSN